MDANKRESRRRSFMTPSGSNEGSECRVESDEEARAAAAGLIEKALAAKKERKVFTNVNNRLEVSALLTIAGSLERVKAEGKAKG
jgi:hypothetical protein